MKKNLQKKIPITAIQGFLGSGKTTLLNNLLTQNSGINIGVVVNDFGELNIDSKLIKRQTQKKLELSNGCICCSLQSLDLQQALNQFSYTDSKIDYVLIEASGLAEPRDLASTLRYSINLKFRLDSIISVLDAHHIGKNQKNHTIARDQIVFSDFVLINKTDLVTKSQLHKIEKLIYALNPRARIFTSTYSKIDSNLLLDKNIAYLGNSIDDHYSNDHSNHLHNKYQTISWQSKKPLDPMKFQKFINQLPNNIYRAKGIINFGKKGANRKYILQVVGVRTDLYWQNWQDDLAKTELVFIGKDLINLDIKKSLSNCIDEFPDQNLPAGIELKLPAKFD